MSHVELYSCDLSMLVAAHFQSSGVTTELAVDVASLADLENISTASSELLESTVTKPQQRHLLKPSFSLPILEGQKSSRIERILSIKPRSGDLDMDKDTVDSLLPGGEVEVIRLKTKKAKVKNARDARRTSKADSESLSSVDIDKCSKNVHRDSKDSLLTPESGYRSVLMDNSSPCSKSRLQVDGVTLPPADKIDACAEVRETEDSYAKTSLPKHESVTWSDDSGMASQLSVDNCTACDPDVEVTSEDANCDNSMPQMQSSSPSHTHNDVIIESVPVDDTTDALVTSSLTDPSLHDLENSVLSQSSTVIEQLESSQECVYDMDRSLELSCDERSSSSGTLSPKTVVYSRDSNVPAATADSTTSPSFIKPCLKQTHSVSTLDKIRKSLKSLDVTENESSSSVAASTDVDTKSAAAPKASAPSSKSAAEQTYCPWDIK